MMKFKYSFFNLIPTVVSLLLFGQSLNAQEDQMGKFRFEGITLKASKDTDIVQEMNAETAQISEDGQAFDNYDVTIRMVQEDGSIVSVSSKKVLYFYNAEEKNEPPSGDEIKEIQNVLEDQNKVLEPGKNDKLLSDPEGLSPVKIDMGTQGEIICQNLYWNEAAGKYMSGGTFIHRINVEGEKYKVTGTRFTADKNFEDVHYVPDEVIFGE